MAYYVFSTLATEMRYASFAKAEGGLPIETDPVVIKGGAGVANRNLITPRGVMTTITDDQHARMIDDPVFQLHQQNGFVTVEHKAADADAVAANMSAADPSRQLEPGDVALDPSAPKVTSGGPGKKARGG